MIKAFRDSKDHAKRLKMDGVPNVVLSHSCFLAFIWTLLTLINGCLAAYFIYEAFIQYGEHKVATSIRTNHELVSVFPTVSICNMNPFSTDTAIQLIKDEQILFASELTNAYTYESFCQLQLNLIDHHGYSLNRSQVEELSSLEDMLVSCEYNGVECGVDDWEFMFHPKYLTCYRFKKRGEEESPKATNIDKDTSLKVVLYAGLNEYLDHSFYRGFYVLIQNETSNPYGSNGVSAFEVTPGLGVMFMPQRTFYEQHEKPYSECTVLEENKLAEELEDRSLFDILTTPVEGKESYAYTQNDCIELCQAEYLLDKCDASISSISIMISEEAFCGTKLEDYECVENQLKLFSSDDMNECLAKCPLECTQSGLTPITVASYNFPSIEYSNAIKAELASRLPNVSNQSDFSNELYNNLVEFSVFYKSLTYTQVEEEIKMTLEDLVASIGSHMHLFLGMSFMTIIEIVELIAIILVSTCKNYINAFKGKN